MVALPFPDHALRRTLRAIKPHRLLAFLNPFRDYFRGRNLELPPPGPEPAVPLDQLVEAILSLDANAPPPLTSALACIVGLGTPEMLPVVLTAAQMEQINLGGESDLTPADVALRLWLRAPHLLERAFAEQSLESPREFEYFRATAALTPPRSAPEDLIGVLEEELGASFDARMLGRSVRVFHMPRPGGLWFLVSHGDLLRREEGFCDCGAEPTSVEYRPLAHDMVVFDMASGELRAHARTESERDLYRRAFGRHLFGREDFFVASAKYTLGPIRRDGAECLRCSEVGDLEWVALREVHCRWGGSQSEYAVIRSDDVFAALRERCALLPSVPELVRAKFEVKFRAAGPTRFTTVALPNIALYDRDQDVSPIEEWLSKRGFHDVRDDNRATPPILARA